MILGVALTAFAAARLDGVEAGDDAGFEHVHVARHFPTGVVERLPSRGAERVFPSLEALRAVMTDGFPGFLEFRLAFADAEIEARGFARMVHGAGKPDSVTSQKYGEKV